MAFTPTYYPVPGVNDTRDLLSIFQFTSNELTGGLLFPLMILVMWVVQFIGVLAEGRPASRAWVAASFTSTIMAIMLGLLAMIEQRWIYLLVIAVSLGAFWIKLASARE